MMISSQAFSSFAVDNLEKARTFYDKILGLKVTDHPMGILEIHTKGNNPIIIYPKEDFKAASYTVLNFPVPDIEAAVEALIVKGIKFEQYAGNIITDEKGISRSEKGPAIAWFKDPAGNILSVIES
ncbi:VOC family protein [Echinicola shivajiensis]|uniref:VOC family protein n=1 Tax=Echinicola shivajiensis TaxID=1035916 RepID=UPI001BFC7DC7|nr:VOC family protein [Echinicola shivajiensis]